MLNTIAITPKSDEKYVVKVFNWSEVHLSEMTCYKIHTLITLLYFLLILVIYKKENNNFPGKWDPPRNSQFKTCKSLKKWLVLDTANMRENDWKMFLDVSKKILQTPPITRFFQVF